MADLKKRWGIQSDWQLVVIFVVFAINGSLSAKIINYFLDLGGVNKENTSAYLYYPLLLLLCLPIYPFLLMVFGWLFGQSKFFFPFAKKMLNSMGMGFVFREK